MDERHENIDDFETIGSPIGGTPLNEDNNQLKFERKTEIIHQEASNLTSRLPDATQPTINVVDPIQHLPPEISTVIVRYTLPPNGRYSPRLLDLTAVSPIWRNFLLSTPVLWSEIYLDDRQHDFLAIMAIFIHLSSEVALRVAIYDRPMNSWTGLSSILAPVYRRIANLTVLESNFLVGVGSDDISRTISAISDFFNHLGHPPQLQELAFGDRAKPTMSAFDSLDLPSTIRVSGTLTVPMPQSARSSATPGRFFDIDKYKSFGPSPFVAPLFRSCRLSLGLFDDKYGTTVQMREEALSHLKLSSKYIHGHMFPSPTSNLSNRSSKFSSVTTKLTIATPPAECGLESLVHIIGASLCHLDMSISLSQVNGLVDFLRVLTRLERLALNLNIMELGIGGTVEISPSNVVIPQLRSLFIMFEDRRNLPLQTVAQAQALRNLFSVLTPLYPSVESLTIWTNAWPFFASSYMERLRRLKYLDLDLGVGGLPYDARHDGEADPITLHSLEQLEVEGQPFLHRLRTPNLLSLRLISIECIDSRADLECLGASCLRKLTIHPMAKGSYTLTPSEYPVLCELNLGMYQALKQVDILLFSSLSSIRLTTKYFTNPEGNHLCTELLYNPEGCSALQELHFQGSLEWDILFLMLERRNFGLEGVRRIHTVTLPFISFLILQNLTPLLAGEKPVRLPLESISLEATREVLFDPAVPGCCWCLKNMVPGCKEKARQSSNYSFGYCAWTPDELYPELRYCPDTVPVDIRDWMDHRRHLVDTWKSSYEGFSQEFSRMERCR